MKVLIELVNKELELYKNKDLGVILPLKDFSVSSFSYYSVDEIRDIVNTDSFSDYFVVINKNIYDKDISLLESVLIDLDKIGVTGVFFYDLSLIEIKNRLNLKIDLVWNQTHMVTNYRTCNFYLDQGVNYSLISKEVCLEDMIKIRENTSMKLMCDVIGRFCIGFTRRSLVSNYYNDLGSSGGNLLELDEKVSGDNYLCLEEDLGSSFYTKDIINGVTAIKELYNNDIDYIILREFGIDDFNELVFDTSKYILGGCSDNNYIFKYEMLGNNTGFFYKRSIFKVKKNG